MMSASIRSISGDKAFMARPAPAHKGGLGDVCAHAGEDLRAGDIREDDRQTSRLKYEPSRFGPAMLPGIGRLGAGSCTIRSQRRQDFLIRAI